MSLQNISAVIATIIAAIAAIISGICTYYARRSCKVAERTCKIAEDQFSFVKYQVLNKVKPHLYIINGHLALEVEVSEPKIEFVSKSVTINDKLNSQFVSKKLSLIAGTNKLLDVNKTNIAVASGDNIVFRYSVNGIENSESFTM